LQLFPGDAKTAFVRLQIGNIHASKGNYAQAIKDFEQIPAGTAERTEGQYHIGEAYQNLHKEAQAAAAFERLMQMGPRDNEYRIAGLMELAKAKEAAGDTGAGLAAIYRDIAGSSQNKDIVLMAQQKLQELKGGQ
jgi:tetratricopeptide (TPR) repeat protein